MSSTSAMPASKQQDGKKRKKAQRGSSSSSEISPQIRKKQKEPIEVFQEDNIEQKSDKMTEAMEARVVSKLENNLQHNMTRMKDETVSELKTFLEQKFNELEEKMSTQVKEVEARLEAKIYGLEEKNTKLRDEVVQVQQENAGIKAEMQCLKAELHGVKNHAVANEQYSRRNNVKIFGLQDEPEENCVTKVVQIVKEKLEIELTASQILAAHRTRSQRKPQPMIVRFDAYATKMSVLKARSRLKGTRVSIAEDLCKDLMTVLNRVKEDDRVVSSWAWGGKVLIKDRHGKVHSVLYGQSLDDIIDDDAITDG